MTLGSPSFPVFPAGPDLLVRRERDTARRPGPGSGATAEATVGANGAVTGLTLTAPGSGYSGAMVAISGAGQRGDRNR